MKDREDIAGADTEIEKRTTPQDQPSLFDPAAYTDGCPHARISAMRRQSELSWQPAANDPSLFFPHLEAGWWLHSYDAVKAALRDPEGFSSQRRTAVLMDPDPVTAEAMGNMILNMDPPLHSRRRRLVSAIFTPRRVDGLEPRVRELARSVVDAIAPIGACDAVTDIAAIMPMQVIAELLGIPERSKQLFDISNRMIGAVDVAAAERPMLSTTAAIEIQMLGQQLAVEKRAKPDASLLSSYVNGTLECEGGDTAERSDEEVGWFLLLLAVAGNETVRTATSQAICILAEHPAQRDLLVSDIDARMPGAIEEILRYRSPVRALRRTATRRVMIDGTTIEEGDKVVCHFSSALRDEKEFQEPDRFDITRPVPAVNLAFGFGEHYCLGASLARLQLRCILGEIYRRIPDIHPSGPAVWQPTPLLEGLLSLPVSFTPEPTPQRP